MKLSVSREDLVSALSIVGAVIPLRSTIPTICGVKLTAEGEHLDVTAFDLDTGITLRIPKVEVKEAGAALLSHAKLSALLGASSSDECSITTDGVNAKIKLSDSSSKLVGMEPSDFPAAPEWVAKGAVKITVESLGSMIRKTRFAASTESARGAGLTGQYFQIKSGKLRICACDGKRLAMTSAKVEGGADMAASVPIKTLSLLEKCLEEDGSVSISITATSIAFKTSTATISSRLLEGKYPDVDAVLNQAKGAANKAEVSSADLMWAVKRCSIATTEEQRAIKLTFSKESIVINSRAASIGEVETKIDAKYEGVAGAVVLNPEYIADYLASLDCEKVEFRFTDKDRATIFKTDGYDYVLMPLQVEV